LLENGGLARARRRDDQTARALPEGSHEIDDARLEEVRYGLEVELLDRVNGGEVLEAHRLGVFGEGHFVDLVHRLELRAVAAMRRLGRPRHETAFAQEIALDCI